MRLTELKRANDFEIVRDGGFEVFGLLDSPTLKPIIAFIENSKYIKAIGANVSCVICPPDIAPEIPQHIGVISSNNPKRLFFELHNSLSERPPFARQQFETNIGSNCSIHKMACVAENNVKIGNNVLIEEFVSIKEHTVIGDNVIIRAGTVIGGEGFYFNKGPCVKMMPVRHFGGVIIEDDVEIQYSSCVDRAHFSWDDTVIGMETKIDNLVHVAHAVKTGKKVFIVALALIGGNVQIGDNVWVGPGSVISNNISVGKNAKVTLGSVVTKNVPDGVTVTGNFAIEHDLFLKDLKKKFE